MQLSRSGSVVVAARGGCSSVICRAGARAACAAWRVSSSRRGRSSSPLVAAARRGRLPCRGFCRSSRRGVSHPLSSWSVVVAALARRCFPVSWRPRRRACGGLPSGLCRWPYLACAWRLAPPGCLWRPCRRGPGVRGVSAFRPSLWHHDTTFSGVCPTSKALTIPLLSCACATKVKISKWLFCCFSVPCGAHI